jgi:hypothetical protein
VTSSFTPPGTALSGQAGERRFNELGLIVVTPGEGVGSLDGPVDVISDPVPELRLASGILELGEQGDPVISYRGHDSFPSGRELSR